MKKNILRLLLLITSFSLMLVIEKAEAGKTFRYHLYKNSQIYQMYHSGDADVNEDEEEDEYEDDYEDDETEEEFEGWPCPASENPSQPVDESNEVYGKETEQESYNTPIEKW